MKALRDQLRELLFGEGEETLNYRLAMVFIDLALVVYFVVTTFHQHVGVIRIIDYLIGAWLLAEWLVRLWVTRDRLAYLSRPLTVVDLAIILSLFMPALTENLVFLRIFRALRLLRSYHLLIGLRKRFDFFRRHEQVLFSATNLVVFVFVISSVVFVLQERANDQISNYADALYFTVTALTTTGFGDITLTGQSGRLLAVVIMVVGLSLFLRLLQTVFRPGRVDFECPDCGLSRHDRDAVHCKHCGRLLHIRTDGFSEGN